MNTHHHIIFASTLFLAFPIQAAMSLADETLTSESPTAQVIEISIQGDNTQVEESEKGVDEIEPIELNETAVSENVSDDNDSDSAQAAQNYTQETSDSDSFTQKLPGEEIHFKLKQLTNSHYLIDGKAESDIGKLLFKSRLMPSNEVKLSIKLKHKEVDDIELIAYFDLANYTMELDGNNAVLNQEHKQMLKVSSAHLQSNFEQEYQDYDFPEHALMLVQMMSYWSVSPDGYKHTKRQVQSNH